MLALILVILWLWCRILLEKMVLMMMKTLTNLACIHFHELVMMMMALTIIMMAMIMLLLDKTWSDSPTDLHSVDWGTKLDLPAYISISSVDSFNASSFSPTSTWEWPCCILVKTVMMMDFGDARWSSSELVAVVKAVMMMVIGDACLSSISQPSDQLSSPSALCSSCLLPESALAISIGELAKVSASASVKASASAKAKTSATALQHHQKQKQKQKHQHQHQHQHQPQHQHQSHQQPPLKVFSKCHHFCFPLAPHLFNNIIKLFLITWSDNNAVSFVHYFRI